MGPFPITAPHLNRNSHAPRQAPPLLETPSHALTSLTSLFYKSHAWPRVWAAPSFPSQPGSSGLPLNFDSWMWDFSHELSLWTAFFLTFWCQNLGFGVRSWHWPCFPSLCHPIPLSLSLSLNSYSLPPGSELLCQSSHPRRHPHSSQGISSAPMPLTAIHHRPILPQGPLLVSPPNTQSRDLFLISSKS
jgi:hypothetical protein